VNLIKNNCLAVGLSIIQKGVQRKQAGRPVEVTLEIRQLKNPSITSFNK